MNDGMTFKEMQNTREFLRKSIDPSNPGATSEINAVRSVMLDQMEHKAQNLGPSVADTFKAYAVNERARENVETIIGGKISSLDQMFAANPDRVVTKIFANPNYAKVVGAYVGPEKMQELIASYIENGVKGAYDSAKGFEPVKLRGWLKTNNKFLDTYAPEIGQRLNALADYGYYGERFLDEVNPSGTADALAKMIKPEGFVNKLRTEGIRGTVVSETVGRAQTALKQRQATKAVNEALGGKPPSGPGGGFKINPNVDKNIETGRTAQTVASVARGGSETGVRSAQNEKPKGGPEKWVTDGINNLNQAGIPMEDLEALKATPKGRELLIEASDASPKSKRMESVLKRIRTASQGGQ
jgi:hypothetical protein